MIIIIIIVIIMATDESKGPIATVVLSYYNAVSNIDLIQKCMLVLWLCRG